MAKKVEAQTQAVAGTTSATGSTSAVAGGNPAIDTAFQDVTNGMAAVEALLGQILTPTERRRLVKVRRSGQQVVATLIELASRKPGLVPPDRDPAALVTQLVEYHQLGALLNAVTGFSTRLRDTVDQEQADLWSAALTIYAIAQQWKSVDAEVSAAVDQMKAALALGTKASQAARKLPLKSKSTSTAVTPPVPTTGTTAQGTGPATTGTGTGTQVQVYGPNGPEGTAPATNSAKS